MNKQVRGWQEDMELCEEMLMNNLKASRAVLAETPEMPMYWLKQYAAEKEQAELWREHVLNSNRDLEAAEAREKKLREAIEDTIDAFRLDGSNYRADTLEQLLASLYPEEETK